MRREPRRRARRSCTMMHREEVALTLRSPRRAREGGRKDEHHVGGRRWIAVIRCPVARAARGLSVRVRRGHGVGPHDSSAVARREYDLRREEYARAWDKPVRRHEHRLGHAVAGAPAWIAALAEVVVSFGSPPQEPANAHKVSTAANGSFRGGLVIITGPLQNFASSAESVGEPVGLG